MCLSNGDDVNISREKKATKFSSEAEGTYMFPIKDCHKAVAIESSCDEIKCGFSKVGRRRKFRNKPMGYRCFFVPEIYYTTQNLVTPPFSLPLIYQSREGGNGVGEGTAGISDRTEVEALPLFCHYVAHTHLNQIVGGACAT